MHYCPPLSIAPTISIGITETIAKNMPAGIYLIIKENAGMTYYMIVVSLQLCSNSLKPFTK
ncbi:hypothetical protein NBG4_60003 [Candidatus Sulfobium mesophilum]|uniref:Uncharacterized protein n=1 Tax=Candidatus Sulfobium mesophilum TaxID=2016548 RepID=A0A2U3QJE8_9BACT|nr:hypothetical protein NBG4_60003 [Candidatus Sulfobium mesophilum]